MRVSTLLLAAVSFSTSTLAFAQAVEEGIAPDESAPPGCEGTVDGNFTIGIAVLQKRESAVEAAGSALACTLKDGILHDPQGRTGSIVANYQFQFDGPPQAGAIYTGGFSLCKNGSLAIGDSTVFYRCMSGEFGNLYDRWIGDQCKEVNIVAAMVEEPKPSSSADASASSSGAASTLATSAKSSGSASLSGSASASASASGSASGSASATTSASGSASSGAASASETGSPVTSATDAPSATESGGPAPNAESTGGAVPTRVPGRETFGAVVGILGAALLL